MRRNLGERAEIASSRRGGIGNDNSLYRDLGVFVSFHFPLTCANIFWKNDHSTGSKGTDEEMRIRALVSKDRKKLHSMVTDTGIFTPEEIDVAMELIDIVLKDPDQKDYQIVCIVNDDDLPLGYLCYGLAPMTQGTIDLYWIVVDLSFQGRGVGSKLLAYLEEVAKGMNGRMILAETSSIPSYDKTLTFYVRKGFKEAARVADYYSPGNDRITFCKRLPER